MFTDSIAPFNFTKTDAEPGNYLMTARAYFSNGDSAVSNTINVTVTGCSGSGYISGEGYNNIPGAQVADLIRSPRYPDSPDVVANLTKFEYGPNYGNNYGARVRGYICAPVTGNYTFYIAGDDQDGLWLSTDENPGNKILVAYNGLHVNFRAWNTYSTQKSAPVKLIKGVRYYIETLHKQASGPNYLSVAWQIPGGAFEAPIPGSRLSPITSVFPNRISLSPDFGIAMQQANLKETPLNPLKFKVTVQPNPSSSFFTLITNSKSDEKLNILLSDIMGRVIMNKNGYPANGTIHIGDELPAGIYIVQIQQGLQKQTIKLVKQ